MAGPMATKVEQPRCVTGIEGLDSILGGGFPTGSLVLVTGVPGVGKTSLALEFSIRGANMGDKSLVLTTVERAEKLLSSIPDFCFLDRKVMTEGTLIFKEVKEFTDSTALRGRPETREDFNKLGENIASYVEKNGIKRLVIDAYQTMFHGVKDEGAARDLLLSLSDTMYSKKCTGIIVADADPGTSIESIIADGVIVLGNYERRTDLLRTMQVLKMKATSHSRSKYVIDLTSCGVLVTPLLRGGA
jgi:KaiC/GvpD/RAD55 family RecA-like ATPase